MSMRESPRSSGQLDTRDDVHHIGMRGSLSRHCIVCTALSCASSRRISLTHCLLALDAEILRNFTSLPGLLKTIYQSLRGIQHLHEWSLQSGCLVNHPHRSKHNMIHIKTVVKISNRESTHGKLLYFDRVHLKST